MYESEAVSFTSVYLLPSLLYCSLMLSRTCRSTLVRS